MRRTLTYSQAIQEALDQCMSEDSNVLLIGEGVPHGVFGTTKSLKDKYDNRVFDSPLSENAITGIAIGASISGMRVVHVHQRADFTFLAMDQIFNNAAKWFSTFGKPCPIVIRMIVGRGWGQGPTHSQSIQAIYAAIPGLKVIMPTTPYDAKGMMIAAIRDNNPVIILEHRWLFDMVGEVPEEIYEVPLDKAKVVCEGTDITIVGTSYATIDALRTAEILNTYGISAEVIDLRSIAPIDLVTIRKSLNKTGRLVVVDTAHKTGSVSEGIVARLVEDSFSKFKCAPVVLGNKDYPQPTSHFLTKDYYASVDDICKAASEMFNIIHVPVESTEPHDKPHKNYSITF